MIYVEDQYGNLETGDNTTSVTVALNTGSGPLIGTKTVTDVGGVATFAGLQDNTIETISLLFTSPSLKSVTSNNIVVGQAMATQLVVHSQPTTATAGSAFSPALVIYVEDQYGDLITSDNTTVVTASLRTGGAAAGNDKGHGLWRHRNFYQTVRQQGRDNHPGIRRGFVDQGRGRAPSW